MAKRMKNAEYAQRRGKQKRLDAESIAAKGGDLVPSSPPLFSHDATLQSYFNKGWNGVSACDVSMHLRETKTPKGADLVSQIRNFRECHFH
ncbi:hypothetical protein [Vibrio owensii]|uniref:hypothetical protein n=2 Tax=Vibrio owensii TaxID=696485 RepID=UPI003908FDF1